MLKLTKVEIGLMSEIDQILFIENNLRGGVSFINQRYAEAGKKKDENGETYHDELLYIDG